jgi:hypothetical protein
MSESPRFAKILPRMARMTRMGLMKNAKCRVFIREIREIRGSIPLVAALPL